MHILERILPSRSLRLLASGPFPIVKEAPPSFGRLNFAQLVADTPLARMANDRFWHQLPFNFQI